MNLQRLIPAVVLATATVLTGCNSTDAAPASTTRTTAPVPDTSVTVPPDPTTTAENPTDDRLDDRAFLDALRRLDAQAGRATRALDRALSSQDVEELKEGLTLYSVFHADAADQVDQWRPPVAAEAATRLLAKGSRLLSMQTLDVVNQLGPATSRTAALRLVNDQLGSASGARQLDRALQRLQALGFEVEVE